MIQREWRGADGTAGLGYWTHETDGSLPLAKLERPISWASPQRATSIHTYIPMYSTCIWPSSISSFVCLRIRTSAQDPTRRSESIIRMNWTATNKTHPSRYQLYMVYFNYILRMQLVDTSHWYTVSTCHFVCLCVVRAHVHRVMTVRIWYVRTSDHESIGSAHT